MTQQMDEDGIDLQVISENNPAIRNLDAESAVATPNAFRLAHPMRCDRSDRR